MISRAEQSAMSSNYRPPVYEDAPFVIESFDPIRYAQSVERHNVRSNENELVEFTKEVERLEALRNSTTDWEPIVVRLLHGDQEIEKKEIKCLQSPF